MKLQESYCSDLKQLLEGLRHQRELRLADERRQAEEEERKNRVREQKEKQRLLQWQQVVTCVSWAESPCNLAWVSLNNHGTAFSCWLCVSIGDSSPKQ